MRKIALAAALAVAGLAGNVAMAGTATGNFNVNITLHSKCQLQNPNDSSWGGGIDATYSSVNAGPTTVLTNTAADTPTNAYPGQTLGDLAMVYTSFQTVDSSGHAQFNVRCTNTLPYTVTISKSASNTANGGANQLDSVLNLNYTLNLSTSTTYASGTNSTVGSQVGTGYTAQTYYVYGTIAADQSGDCDQSVSCTNSTAADRQRWVTIDF